MNTIVKSSASKVPVFPFRPPSQVPAVIPVARLVLVPPFITPGTPQYRYPKNFDTLRSSSLYFAPTTRLHNHRPSSPDEERKQQNKKANLGKVIETLQLEIPDILTTLISSELIASDIAFRICPSTHSNIPTFKGYVPYVTTAKTLQLSLTQFILNPNVKVHIRKTKVVDPKEGTSSYGLYKNTTKIIMNWKTCQENCPHLIENEETSKGSRGKHTWSELDHATAAISQNYGLKNLKLTDDKIERILSGIFVFELDEVNEKIKVFTIEDVEILENREWIGTPGSAAC